MTVSMIYCWCQYQRDCARRGISSTTVIFLWLTIYHRYENFPYQNYPLHDNSIFRFFLCTLSEEIKVYKSGIEQELKHQKYLDCFLKLTPGDADLSGRSSVKRPLGADRVFIVTMKRARQEELYKLLDYSIYCC